MTATDETAIDDNPDSGAVSPDLGNDAVARAAAHDVARLLDRRGLREVVALARRVLRDSALLAPGGGLRPEDPGPTLCTLREHERSPGRSAADRAVDDHRT